MSPAPKPGPPPQLCPQCSRTMRPHCPKTRCLWLFCGVCNVTLDVKSGTHMGRPQP